MTEHHENCAEGIGRRSLRLQGVPPPNSDHIMMTNHTSPAPHTSEVQNQPYTSIGMPIAPIPMMSPFPPREIQVLAPPEFTPSVHDSSNDSSSSQSIQTRSHYSVPNPQFRQFEHTDGYSTRSAPNRTGANNVPITHKTFKIHPWDIVPTTCIQIKSTS